MRGRLTGGRRRTGKRANGRVIVPPLEGIELLRLRLPLVRPWRTAHGVLTGRDVILVRAVLDGTVGWAECSAQPEPTYSSEYVDGALDVLDRHLVPRLLDEDVGSGDEVQRALVGVKGHPMAKAALELAVLDAELRAAGIPLARHLGARSVPSADPAPRVMAGVAVGVTGSIDELVNEVGQRVAEHYHRVKLKIQPGWDLEPVRAVREAFGPDLLLQVDANGSYPGLDAATDALRLLDDAGLLLVEQPLGDADLLGHAELARRLSTPVCLDESITSAAATETALALGACSVINIKAARVGGYLEALRVNDRCRARGVPVWCGGMLETGVGRAANLALAALPNFSIPGDLSGSDRFWAADIITDPIRVDPDGTIDVPQRPGIGVGLSDDQLARAIWRRWYPAG